MTRYENKEYNFLKKHYERVIVPKLWEKSSEYDIFEIHSFSMQAMRLLEEYHIKDIQYRERIKTLKGLLNEKNKN